MKPEKSPNGFTKVLNSARFGLRNNVYGGWGRVKKISWLPKHIGYSSSSEIKSTRDTNYDNWFGMLKPLQQFFLECKVKILNTIKRFYYPHS